MKTAILKTNLWDDDDFYELNIDTKLLYLLLLSSPERGVSNVYKINDRILSARSGLNIGQLNICKKQLEEHSLVLFYDKYLKLTDFAYVNPTKGNFTKVSLERELKEVPVEVLTAFDINITDTLHRCDTGATQEHINKDINKDNNKDNNNRKYTTENGIRNARNKLIAKLSI